MNYDKSKKELTIKPTKLGLTSIHYLSIRNNPKIIHTGHRTFGIVVGKNRVTVTIDKLPLAGYILSIITKNDIHKIILQED